MPTAQHRRFDQGMNQDENSGALGEGYCYSSKNMLYDKLGITRKRGGVLGIGSTTAYGGDNLGILVKDDGTEQAYSRGSSVGAGAFSAVNLATGAFTNSLGALGDVNPDGGRPFQHYGFLIFPMYGATAINQATIAFAGAQPSSSFTFATPASVAFTAGDKRITCAAGDNPLVNLTVGQIIYIQWGAAFQNWYVGRVTRLVSTTAFEVFPTPVTTSTTPVTAFTRGFGASSQAVGVGHMEPAYVGSKVGMSFQGRVCLANLSIYNAGNFARTEVNPRGFAFSSVLLEQPVVPAVSVPPNEYTGATWLLNEGFPKLNVFNIPAQEAITAISPTGFGDAVIFSAFRAFRLTGNLTTQFGTDQSITWATREIPNSVGCISERSMQRTPRGIVFAHDSGIYATDGSSMHPLMYKRMGDYWKGLQGTLFKVYGSALIHGNHYYICGVDSGGTPWGLMCNLDTLAWGPITGKTAPGSWLINSAVIDSIDSSRVWGLKWWNQSGAAPSMTGGQLVELDTMFVPSAANRADSDGTTVNFEHVTRPYHEDQPTVQKDWLGATILYNNKGGNGVGVTPGFVAESEDLPAGGNTTQLPKQDVYTVTAGTGTGLLIVLTIGAGHTITQDSWVRVSGVLGNTNANGLWRVQAVTGTTVTLMGSIGNTAYSSGGTVQNVDERDITLQNAVPIGGNPTAVVYRINDTDLGTGGADEFEILGITHTWEDRDIHVE